MRLHPTAKVVVGFVLLSALLSFLPLPQALRPLPALREAGAAAAMWRLALGSDRSLDKGGDKGGDKPPSESPARSGVQPGTAPAAPEKNAREAANETSGRGGSDARSELFSALGAKEADSLLQLEKLRLTVGAKLVDLSVPQRIDKPNEGALDYFFSSLSDLSAGKAKENVRVVVLGDSLIASDYITATLRRRLQTRYGNGGVGFLFGADPFPDLGNGARAGHGEGWQVARLTDVPLHATNLGLFGASFTAGDRAGSYFSQAQQLAALAQVFYALPKGASLEVFGHHLAFTASSASEIISLGAGTKGLQIVGKGGAVLYGVAFESRDRGVVLDAIGLPGATTETYLHANLERFDQQLSDRAPKLVVLMLGGNDAFAYAQGRGSLAKIEQNLTALIAQVRRAAADASCLVITPIEAGVANASGGFTERLGTAEVVATLIQGARAAGCATWNMYDAMGGRGAIERWNTAGIMNEDLVHPVQRGAELLGHLVDVALAKAALQAENTRDQSLLTAPAKDPAGLENGAESLPKFFAKLKQLKAHEFTRVGILQLGASHTAAQFFTDQMRRRLSALFGDAGRGYVAIGRPSERLAASGVERWWKGHWTLRTALKAPADQIWGLTGIRAEGQKDASFGMRFVLPKETSGKVQLYYLQDQAMGQLKVSLDKNVVMNMRGSRAPLPQNSDAEVVVAEWSTVGGEHTLTVENEGPGPVELFGVAVESNTPGIVYDALGLPGATALTTDAYNKEALSQQLLARRPDLYVLFYGTNESALNPLDASEYEKHYRSLLATLRRGTPMAECLIIGPTDRMDRDESGDWQPVANEDTVIGALRRVAKKDHCAFWSARAAMGGTRSIARWLSEEPALALSDHVHLTERGYQLLADALSADLLSAFYSAVGP